MGNVVNEIRKFKKDSANYMTLHLVRIVTQDVSVYEEKKEEVVRRYYQAPVVIIETSNDMLM